jgi:hypothetical protein
LGSCGNSNRIRLKPAFFLCRKERDLWLSLGALFLLLLAFPLVPFWLVAPANAGFLAAKVRVRHSAHLLRLAFQLGNAPCQPMRTPVVRTCISLSIAATRREPDGRAQQAGLNAPNNASPGDF